MGYTNNDSLPEFSYKVSGVNGEEWYFSDKAFIDFKNKLEDRLNWTYSGENEIIVLQSNINGRQILNFENYVAININEGLRKEYICSYSMFMESLIRHSKSEVTASKAIKKVYRFRKRHIIEMAIEDNHNIPEPVKKILKNKIFFRTSKA